MTEHRFRLTWSEVDPAVRPGSAEPSHTDLPPEMTPLTAAYTRHVSIAVKNVDWSCLVADASLIERLVIADALRARFRISSSILKREFRLAHLNFTLDPNKSGRPVTLRNQWRDVAIRSHAAVFLDAIFWHKLVTFHPKKLAVSATLFADGYALYRSSIGNRPALLTSDAAFIIFRAVLDGVIVSSYQPIERMIYWRDESSRPASSFRSKHYDPASGVILPCERRRMFERLCAPSA